MYASLSVVGIARGHQKHALASETIRCVVYTYQTKMSAFMRTRASLELVCAYAFIPEAARARSNVAKP